MRVAHALGVIIVGAGWAFFSATSTLSQPNGLRGNITNSPTASRTGFLQANLPFDFRSLYE
jgi:hypothetical protein